MDLRQLSYFLEVANHGSFSKASEAIHLSQPTLSKMVKNLEDELGVVLFNRSTRKVELTDAGKVVLTHAQSVLHAAQHLLLAVADLTEMKSGQFRLGLPPVIGSTRRSAFNWSKKGGREWNNCCCKARSTWALWCCPRTRSRSR